MATTLGMCVPLVYAERVLFNSIFQKGLPTGDLLGAIPSALLTGVTSGGKMQGFASLKDHYQCCLTTAGTGTINISFYITHTFDVMANVALQGCDTLLIIWVYWEPRLHWIRMRNNDQDFYTDSIDNCQVVNKLSSAEWYYASTYFATGTCNQCEQLGVWKVRSGLIVTAHWETSLILIIWMLLKRISAKGHPASCRDPKLQELDGSAEDNFLVHWLTPLLISFLEWWT